MSCVRACTRALSMGPLIRSHTRVLTRKYMRSSLFLQVDRLRSKAQKLDYSEAYKGSS